MEMDLIKILLIFLIGTVRATTDLNQPRICEPIRVELCRGIGYNETSMPNLVGHELQSDADFTLQTFSPLIQYGCSAQLNFFLCAAYVPMCTTKVTAPIGPCRSLCEAVRARCHPVLQGFGFPWPAALDCSRFPKENNHEHMCMEGPGEPGGGVQVPSSKSTTFQPSCQGYVKSHLYVRLNHSGRCAPLCEADILFSHTEKHLAELWITAWSYAALFMATIATLCLVLSNVRWDKILMPLVICHCLVAVGWAVRWLAGRNSTACSYDTAQMPGVSLLLTDGTEQTAPCAATFLLRYYFGMSAAVWWAILCYKWNLSVRRFCSNLTAASINNNNNSSTEKDSSYGILIQLIAWGLPAIFTIAVLIARLVDAEELLGSCFIGNQSDKVLLSLVCVPLLVFWMIGSAYLFTAYLRKKSMTKQLPANESRVGTFLFIYCVPNGLLLILIFYEFANRENWLNVPHPSMEPTTALKAPMWPFMMRIFTELLIGVLASAWAVGPRIAGLFKCKQPKPVYKAPSSQPQYIQSPYTMTASYHTVCQQSSIPSIPSIQIGRIPRHSRKYPPYANRKSRTTTYQSSSQTMSLTGNETIL